MPEVRIRSAAWFPPGLVISAEANLVEMAATVRDRQGHLAGGLHASDFEVLDNNQRREITVFAELRGPAPETAPRLAAGPTAAPSSAPPRPEPRFLALFFDDAHASMPGVHKSAEAAQKLIRNKLQPGDRVGLFTSSGTVDVDFTDDKERLLAAIAHLRPRPVSSTSGNANCPTLTPYAGYVIQRHLDPAVESAALAEAIACFCGQPPEKRCILEQHTTIDLAARTVWEMTRVQFTSTLEAMGIVMRHLAAAPGKRLLILLSPGFPTGDMEQSTSGLMDLALRANIRISGVNSEGLDPRISAARRLVNNEFMADAAKATGGQFLHDTNDWTGGLEAVTAEPEVSYLLGFAAGEPDGAFHALKTRISGNRGYKVESRAGYFAAAAGTETVQHRIDRLALSGEERKEFPVSVQAQPGAGEDGRALHVTITVDAGGLEFPEKESRRVQELTFLTVLEDAQGNFLAGKQSVMDLALSPATLAEKRRSGIRAATALPLPGPGSYRVREVVREAAQDRIWASSTSVEIR